MAFHEFLLDQVCQKLQEEDIPYTRPNKKRGSDLVIEKMRIELEIRSSPDKKPENRPSLIQRSARYPENTILILLNKEDKQIYLKSKIREIITGNNRFLTLQEFLEKAEKLFKTSKQSKIPKKDFQAISRHSESE